MFRDVTPLVRPRTVAVIGASSQRVSQGNVVIANLKEWDFPGRVIPVHPRARSIDGIPAVASPEALPGGTDVAVVAVPASGVVEVLSGLERAGVRGAIVYANGFARDEEAEVRRFVEASSLVVHGPNCMGLINMTDQVPLYPTRPSERVRSGSVALVAQSGSAAITIMGSAAVGFSKVVTVGSEFQTSAADYVRWLAADADTSAIGVVAERIGDPVAFARAAESAHAAGKPLVVLKVGTSASGAAAARAHTGALIGKRDAYDRYFAECDIATVSDYDELIACLECTSVPRRAMKRGARLAVVGISGGQTALACDVVERAAIPLACFGEATAAALERYLPGSTGANPVDIGQTVREEDRRIAEAVSAVLADDDVGGLALIQDAQATLNPRSLRSYEPVFASYGEAAGATDKPVVLISPSAEALHETVASRLASHGVPVLRGLREGVTAIRNLSKGVPGCAGAWAELRNGGGDRRGQAAELISALGREPGALSTETCYQLLDLYGIPRVASIVVDDEQQALERAGDVGFPMVVKLVSRDVAHRSDVGGVVLGVEDAPALSKAIARITDDVSAHLGESAIAGFELQRELRGRVEAIVGFTAAPPFGALVAVGAGGTMVELDADRALGLSPLSVAGAEQMIGETRLGRLLGGYRNLMPETDVSPLARLVVELSVLASELGDLVTACDLNPVLIEKGTGVVHVVDVLMLQE